MRNASLLLLAIFVYSCGSSKKVSSIDDIFNSLKKKAEKSNCGIYPNLFYQNKKSFYQDMGFINLNKDSLYILQEYDIQTGELIESIWNEDSKFEYKSFKGKSKKSSSTLYPTHVYKDLVLWNPTKMQSVSHGFGANKVSAYRIIIDDGKLFIDCFVF